MPTKPQLKVVYCRLFKDDAKTIERYAYEKGSAFQTELRLLVREAVQARKRRTVIS